MTYKIGLLSSHGTGKTWLAHSVTAELKRRGYSVRVLSEVATDAKESGKRINEGTTLKDQAWILHTQASHELAAELVNPDVIICDRTMHDNYVYLENACGRNEHYLKIALGHALEHPYNALYYIPILQEPTPDGVRSVDPIFQRTIDDKLVAYLERENVHHTKLNTATSPGRAEWVDIIVKDALQWLKK
ncbi:ATP-binding protein [Candidatus Woesearchaeota archaeon]|nr:ATP-binding protein [Candidatus Woesearchaeota archaeon]